MYINTNKNMKTKYKFKDNQGFGVVIEHDKPFTKFQALKILSKHLRNRKFNGKLR